MKIIINSPTNEDVGTTMTVEEETNFNEFFVLPTNKRKIKSNQEQPAKQMKKMDNEMAYPIQTSNTFDILASLNEEEPTNNQLKGTIPEITTNKKKIKTPPIILRAIPTRIKLKN